MVHFDVEVKELSPLEQLEGKLASDPTEQRLMRSVLQNDKQKIEDGRLLSDAVNRGLNSFVPDLMFANLTSNFKIAKQLYGERIIRLVAGKDADYVERNIAIPEYKKHLQQIIRERIERLREGGLLGADGSITEQGVKLSTITTYLDELDRIEPKGTIGERHHKEKSRAGENAGIRQYQRGDRYKDVDLRATLRQAIKRGRKTLERDDLKTAERESKGAINVVYALDASASMKGEKLEMAKKSGIALAHKAINRKDNVGLIVFGKEVTEAIAPTQDFPHILDRIARIRASKETDYTKMLAKATELLSDAQGTKHILILTDALPTTGKEPETETLRAINNAKAAGITTSIIGINLDQNGIRFAKEMATGGDGRFILARNLEEVDRIVLQEYETVGMGT